MWALSAVPGPAANGAAVPASRLDGECDFDMAMLGDRFTGTPNAGFGLSDGGSRDLRIGWRPPVLRTSSPARMRCATARRDAQYRDQEVRTVTV